MEKPNLEAAPHNMSKGRQYLGLDIIRFATAALVMVYHLAYWNWQAVPHGARAERYKFAFGPIQWLAAQGWVGVPIFFVLSGFVIAFSANGKSVAVFAKDRIARLYPAAWICSSLTFAVLLVSNDPNAWARYVRSMLLWPIGPWVSGVYWTLGVECVFYCLVGLFLAMIGSRSLRLVGGGLIVASGGYLGLRGLDIAILHGTFSQLKYFESPVGSLLLLSSGGYFALGIFLWATMVDRPRSMPSWSIVVAALVSLVAVTAAAHSRVTGSGASKLVLLAPTLWALAVLGIALSVRYADWLQLRLGMLSGEIKTLGLLTYPLYLLHDVMGTSIMQASLGLPPILALAFAIAATLACSYAVVKTERYPRWVLSKVWNVRIRPVPAEPSDLP